MSLGKEILTIRIILEKKKSDIISVHERDEPWLLAQKFCIKHQLNNVAFEAILYMIDKNLDILVDEEIAGKNCSKPRDFYAESIKIKQKTQQKIESIRKNIEIERDKELTFKPKILESSLNILASSNPNFKIQNSIRKKFENSDKKTKNTHEKSKSQVFNSFFSPKSCLSTAKKDDFCKTSTNFFSSKKPLSSFQSFHNFSSSILSSMHEKSKILAFSEEKNNTSFQ